MNEASPIVIQSSSPRAGSTLVQRLLSSSKNTLIYGDAVGQEVDFFVAYVATKCQLLDQQASMIDPLRQSVLDGRDDHFIAKLLPERGAFKDSLRSSALQWLSVCERDAAQAGRENWGWKTAGPNPYTVPILAEWLPKARFVTLTRDLSDAARSAKAAGIIQCAQSFQSFCQLWSQNETAFQDLLTSQPGRVLALTYDDLISKPQEAIESLQSFTGASGIKAEIFEKKLNTAGSANYLTPDELTEDEEQVIAKFQLNTQAA
jgi:hypothetical protein